MGTLDLDSMRAARAEVDPENKGHVLRVGGRDFTLPAQVPLGFADACLLADTAEGAQHAFRILVGPEQWPAFVEMRLDSQDLGDILVGLRSIYGIGPGESSASNGSSTPSGDRSRPTSNGSTRSTSGKPGGAKKRSARGG